MGEVSLFWPGTLHRLWRYQPNRTLRFGHKTFQFVCANTAALHYIFSTWASEYFHPPPHHTHTPVVWQPYDYKRSVIWKQRSTLFHHQDRLSWLPAHKAPQQHVRRRRTSSSRCLWDGITWCRRTESTSLNPSSSSSSGTDKKSNWSDTDTDMRMGSDDWLDIDKLFITVIMLLIRYWFDIDQIGILYWYRAWWFWLGIGLILMRCWSDRYRLWLFWLVIYLMLLR